MKYLMFECPYTDYNQGAVTESINAYCEEHNCKIHSFDVHTWQEEIVSEGLFSPKSSIVTKKKIVFLLEKKKG